MGWTEYEPIAARYRVPIVVTGFEPVDILEGMLHGGAAAGGRAGTRSRTSTSARCAREGTVPARDLVAQVFRLVDRQVARHRRRSRGAGSALREEFADFDAECRFGLGGIAGGRSRPSAGPATCSRGSSSRIECPAFGTRCTPEHPLGAPMVSSEGACAAYYNYGRFRAAAAAEA